MLSPYRVLDLSDERGLLCGQILADLGADVVQVEPPGGSSARRVGPFFGDVEARERSLYWWAYARNKRSVVLDQQSEAGRRELRALASEAHFLIESGTPGALAHIGLGYADLAALNPALVYVSISAFGQDGPKSGWSATDVVVMAASGPMILTGDADRAPLRMSVPQAWQHASAEAAAGALVAHHERVRSGRGQHVDVSAQQAVTAATQMSILWSAVGDVPISRVAGGARAGPVELRLVYPAKDGHVSITHVFGSAIGPATRRLMEYVYEQGFCDEATRDKDWIAYGELLLRGKEPIEEFDRVKACVAACTASRTKADLLDAALERGLLLAPIMTLADVAASEQLAARGYFREVLHEELGASVRFPGPFAKFSAAPLAQGRRAPLLGEHQADVLHAAPAATTSVPGPRPGPPERDALPLRGVKILDFMWALAGPGATRILADYGATVVRVESTTRLDVCRTLHPYPRGEVGPENSACFHSINVGKLMLTLDPRTREGRAVALDLVRWADVVTESFSPRGMKGLGLDYETLRGVKPDLIMLSTCLMGQTGPLARFAGFGNLAAAIAGFYGLAGWPDRDPAGPFGAYTDYIAPRYNAIAVLAALEHRRRTGEGQHIDLSQAEAALHFLAPAILDYTANGRVQSRHGNRDPQMAPHGVYPTAGSDAWIAIAVQTDEQWRALCTALGQSSVGDDERYATTALRLESADVLDRFVADTTAKWDRFELEACLQRACVPASAVMDSPDLVRDPQLLGRDHFVELPHPQGGTTVVEGSRSRLSRTPARVDGTAPTLGRDTEHVLRDILGYSDERITELVIASALE